MHASLRKVALLGVVYASQGLAPGFAAFAMPVLLRRGGVSLQAVGLAGLLLLPVALKFVFGPWTDRLARAGRIRAWMLGLQVALALCFAALAFTPPARGLLPFLLLVGLAYLIVAVADVMVDGLAVRLLTFEERPLGNAAQYGGYYGGSILAGGLFLALEPRLGWVPSMVLLSALVGAGAMAAQALVSGAVVAGAPALGTGAVARETRPSVLVFVRGPVARRVLPLLLLLDLPQNVGIALAAPFLLDAGLSQPQVGLVSGTAGLLAALAGALLGGAALAHLPRRRAILVAGALQSASLLGFGWLALTQPINVPAALGVVAAAYALASAFNVTLSSWFMDEVSKEQPATDYSVMACAHTLTFVVANPIAGALAPALGFPIFFVGVTAVALALLATAWPWLRRPPASALAGATP